MSDELNQDETSLDSAQSAMQPEDTLSEIKAQNKELMDNWKRTAADFENYKRRKESEGKELLEYSKEIIVMKMLPSLQSLEQVLKFAPTDEKYKDWLLGLKATIIQLEKTMEELGVVKIKTVGEQFDPNLHEAIEEQKSDEDGILKEVQPGFMLNSKVIIPAKVVVGRKNS
ncbi:MAG: nucleotide exchange factor GrpE [Candidatus Doudnabacteria bacterium]|nr:nucleotide exchange factor GrpE [Candidatus Doudnabacteria bacterium]